MLVAQKVKEAEITEQDSLLDEELADTSMTEEVFENNISYIRGLFPEKYFNDKSVPALEMKIKKLLPLDAESRRLIDWMEKGVYDALQKKYLKTLLFSICEAVNGPTMEEYTFSFSYPNPDSEEVSMNISRAGSKKQGGTFNSTNEVTPNQMKSSACKMIRTLVQLMRTLDKMPEESKSVFSITTGSQALDELLGVITHGINAGDVKKLQDADIYTCNGLLMNTKKSLIGVKGLSEAKVVKICEAVEKIVNYGYITGSDALLQPSQPAPRGPSHYTALFGALSNAAFTLTHPRTVTDNPARGNEVTCKGKGKGKGMAYQLVPKPQVFKIKFGNRTTCYNSNKAAAVATTLEQFLNNNRFVPIYEVIVNADEGVQTVVYRGDVEIRAAESWQMLALRVYWRSPGNAQQLIAMPTPLDADGKRISPYNCWMKKSVSYLTMDDSVLVWPDDTWAEVVATLDHIHVRGEWGV